MSEITTIRLDLAKNVFQVHGADDAGRAKLRDTAERLSQRFSGEYAWELAGRYLRENRGSFGSSAGGMLREKPLRRDADRNRHLLDAVRPEERSRRAS